MSNIIEGEFKELDDGTTIGTVPKEHKNYRTWVYNKIDGEMQSKVVDGPTATLLYAEGWRMTPAEFTDNPELKGNPQFEQMADTMSQTLNFLLNIDVCDDKQAIEEFAVDFLGMKLVKQWSVSALKKNVIKVAKEKGLI